MRVSRCSARRCTADPGSSKIGVKRATIAVLQRTNFVLRCAREKRLLINCTTALFVGLACRAPRVVPSASPENRRAR
jgi:hypothetical protein